MNSKQAIQLAIILGNSNVSMQSRNILNKLPILANRRSEWCCMSSSSNVGSQTRAQQNNKDDILPDYVNRNPRNLEMLRIARKPLGYDLDARLHYWYKLEYAQAGRHIKALVRHIDGSVVLTASTEEWSVQSRLPSTSDHTATLTVAKLLARRCLEAGLTEISTDLFEAAESSKKLSSFLNVMSENGVRLEEDFQLHECDMYPWAQVRPTTPWQVTEDIELKKYDTLDNADKTKQNTQSKD